tara:strand:- start:9031 stop:12183 length:3153 start_codon:yes stop_codon:yes gene_type:complete
MTGGEHSADFERLVERRRKFIEGLNANRGEINLDIFEDFYPDKAHFVYELLQNAEDAGATQIAFTLTPEKLVCEHNGRAFTLADVTSITGLHDSTKAGAPDKIGKFGVGFKSVFVYTQAPSIRSGAFAFRIAQLILPEPISPDGALDGRTRFEFPFDNPKKPPAEAYAEIASGLNELDEKTLLFLSNLQSVKWRVGAQSAGEVVRVQHSDFHFEVLKEIGDGTGSSSHFLKFDQAVPGLEKQRVAVAFPLDILPGVRSFTSAARLADQLKIIPAEPGNVAVFFPAVKEASGLRFHLHGPFVPELSRASIKETKANTPLFEQLAVLAAASLHHIKELGLLTPDFLSVLPNPQDQVSLRYQSIRAAIIAEMKSQPLTPTHDKGHAPASRLIQAKASLKALLSEADIEFLVEYEDVPPLWVIGAAQKNNRIDQFLSGLSIREWGIDEFVEMLGEKATTVGRYISASPYFVTEPDETFMRWLEKKPPEWLQQFYALLHDEAVPMGGLYGLKSFKIVRMRSGAFGIAAHSFFESDHAGDSTHTVDALVYSSGKSKPQQEKAKKFLSDLGVRELGEAEEVELILKARYTREAEIPDDKTYVRDLKRFIALVKRQPDKAKLFASYFIFLGGDDQWHTPAGIYLDQPYKQTDISAYFGRLGEDAECAALHTSYRDIGIKLEQVATFALAVGVQANLEIATCNCRRNPKWDYLRSVGGDRYTSPIDRDFCILKLDELLKAPSLKLSRLIWRTLSALPSHPDYLQATYQRNQSWGARYAESLLVYQLRDAAWIPQGDGGFVRPADASRELLPKGFPFDPGYAWLKAIQFGESAVRRSEQTRQKEAAAKSLGFADAAAAELARRFSDLPQSEQEKFLAEYENRNKPALPDRPLANPERRAQHVHEQALNAPDKQSEIRERSVSIGREDVKLQADTYLREHYRNADGEVTCQICKGPLPFKLDDGREYFEVVEFLPELTKRHPQNYLALCPNHSAMYRLVNGSKENMREDFQALVSNELSVLLADQELTVYFSKTHIIDLKAVLDAEESLSVPLSSKDDTDR